MKKTILLLSLAVSLILGSLVVKAENAFKDVSPAHPFAQAIKYVKDEGIVRGYDNGKYEPGEPINRAEFMKIVIEAVVGNEPFVGKQKCFDDVETDVWYYSYVCYGKKNGIIAGYPDGNFKPGQDISFVEAAKIMVNAFGYDSTKSEPWYKSFVMELVKKKAVPASITAFDHRLTRGEMAEIIHALKTEIPTNNSQSYDEIGAWVKFKNEKMDVKFNEDGLTLLSFRPEKGYFETDFFVEKFDRVISLAAMVPGFDPSKIDEMRAYTCGVDTVSLEDFCEDCEKLGDHVAADYHSYFSGDAVFAGFVFSEWSTNYPSMCFTLGMNDALDKTAEIKKISYIEAASGEFNIGKLIRDKELGDELFEMQKWLEEFGKSLKRK